MLNKELEQTLNEAFIFAREHRHEFMTVEHLLLALLDNGSATEALQACGANVDIIKKELTDFVKDTTPLLLEDANNERETQPTLGFQRVLQRAVFHVQSSGKEEVTGANVLVAIFSEQESQAVYILKKADVTRLDVVNFISHIQRVYNCVSNDVRHVVMNDTKRQTFRDGGFTHASFTNKQRVVFTTATQYLNTALNFEISTNQRINFPFFGQLIQIGRVLLKHG